MPVCHVPTLSAKSADCGGLFTLWREYGRVTHDVTFDFSVCRFLRPQAVAFLGGLARLIEHRGGKVVFLWDTLIPAVAANLAQNGFMAAFDHSQGPWKGNSVPYLHHPARAPEAFSDYVHQAWLGRGWLGMSGKLADQMTSSMSEAYLNTFEHADSPVGMHCCGQFFPSFRVLSLTLVDFGVGIPARVRRFKAAELPGVPLTGEQCLRWAFQLGASTRTGGMSGGLGLDILKEFITVNKGTLEFYSHEGRAFMDEGATTFSNCDDYFEGTMITVLLRCDERHYALGSELASLNPFQSP